MENRGVIYHESAVRQYPAIPIEDDVSGADLFLCDRTAPFQNPFKIYFVAPVQSKIREGYPEVLIRYEASASERGDQERAAIDPRALDLRVQVVWCPEPRFRFRNNRLPLFLFGHGCTLN